VSPNDDLIRALFHRIRVRASGLGLAMKKMGEVPLLAVLVVFPHWSHACTLTRYKDPEVPDGKLVGTA
jgi:hypothetical protein